MGNLNFETSCQCGPMFFIAVFQQSPALLPQPDMLVSKQKFSRRDKRIVIIFGSHRPGAPALQKHFWGCLLVAGKCWVGDLGFHSRQYVLSGTETFPLISFTYLCSPLSPLTVISQALHVIHSLTVHVCTTDPSKPSFLSTLFPFIFLIRISLSASGNWKFRYNLPA